jgi:thiosulfate/3-mercaptopyruvate sulfurtransferase
MRRVGVTAARPVVVYDDWAGRAAARAWWLLRFHGHPDVRVLDGGWPAWLAAGLPVATGEERPEPGDLTADPGHLPLLAPEEVAAFPDRGTLLDARDPERFRGEREPVDPVAGHVPGARNVPTGANLREDGTFRDAEGLRAVYADALAGPVAAYCGSGVTAAHDLLALAVLGVEGALYAGSWSGWVSDRDRPVATEGQSREGQAREGQAREG